MDWFGVLRKLTKTFLFYLFRKTYAITRLLLRSRRGFDLPCMMECWSWNTVEPDSVSNPSSSVVNPDLYIWASRIRISHYFGRIRILPSTNKQWFFWRFIYENWCKCSKSNKQKNFDESGTDPRIQIRAITKMSRIHNTAYKPFEQICFNLSLKIRF